MRQFLVETLEDEGHDPEIDEYGNVIASRGTSGTHIVLNTHIDTVPPHVAYERDGDIVRGRGACDAKGSLAAIIDAFCSASIDSGRLTLAVTPNEETSQTGGAHLGKTLTADAYIVGEPTGLDVCTAARGNFGGEIMLFGEYAHASEPNRGSNVIHAIGPLVEALKHYDEKCGPEEHHLLGSATLAPTCIEIGGPVNQVPGDGVVSFDRRTVPPETIDGFIDELQSFIRQRLPDEINVEVRAAFPDSANPEAFETSTDTELVKTLADMGGGDVRLFEAATEASYFANNGPTVVFGPGVLADDEGPVAHSNREYVSRREISAAATALRKTVDQLV
jgi:acetylornithine deacetylase/succinyl-diaminopimelate desuccinylase